MSDLLGSFSVSVRVRTKHAENRVSQQCLKSSGMLPRPRENRCKWFNNLGVTKRSVYIYLGGKCKNSPKNNIVNRFINCVNRFRKQGDKPDGLWWFIRFRHNMNWFKMPRMKIEAIQIILNWFNISHKVLMIQFRQIWLDSKYHVTIHTMYETLGDTIQAKVNRFISSEKLFWQQWWGYLNDKVSGPTKNHTVFRDTVC